MTIMSTLTFLATGANVFLTALLLGVYIPNFARTRSAFTLGLVLFAGLFFLQNILWLYCLITMMPLFATGLESYMLVLSLLQTAALAVMNFTTWR